MSTHDETELLGHQDVDSAQRLKLPDLGDTVDETKLRLALTMFADLASRSYRKDDSDNAAYGVAWMKREMERSGFKTDWLSNDRPIPKDAFDKIGGTDGE